MAPETRVGLVVGLGFIICFAVILANRGQRSLPSTYLSHVPQQAQVLPGPTDFDTHERSIRAGAPSAQPQWVGNEGVVDQFAEDNAADPRASLHRTMPLRVDLHAQPAEQNPDLGTFESGQRPAAPEQYPGLPKTPGQNGVPVSSPLDRPESMRPAVVDQRPTNSEFHREMQMQVRNGSGEGRSSYAQVTEAKPMIRHKVQPGESLSKIAARYYGRSTAASVKEIYEANRNVMTSPDVLHAGVELVIPNARASTRLVEKRAEPRRTPPVRTAKPILQTRAVDFRWYQVKKQDRYYSIARRELGDASRWHEIFELNKDKFPDPGRIREGVRIKLPKSSSAARQGT